MIKLAIEHHLLGREICQYLISAEVTIRIRT